VLQENVAIFQHWFMHYQGLGQRQDICGVHTLGGMLVSAYDMRL